jgi:hypothetical protein
VYPNPVKDFITIEKETTEVIDFQIIDLLGRIHLNEQLTSQIQLLDISKLENGIYFLKLEGHISKFVVSK